MHPVLQPANGWRRCAPNGDLSDFYVTPGRSGRVGPRLVMQAFTAKQALALHLPPTALLLDTPKVGNGGSTNAGSPWFLIGLPAYRQPGIEQVPVFIGAP